MKLTVKTLKGEKFPIEVEASLTVEQVKGVIESAKSELPAANMRLIFSGKVLKDADALESCGVKENDFLVVMVAKPKKAATPAPAPSAPAPATPVGTSSSPTPSGGATATSTTQEAAATPAVAAQTATPAAPERPATSEFPAEVVANLTVLGFPETEVRHCLRAAQGNPDVAVEFLTNGIPPGVNVDGGGASPSSGSSSGGEPLQNLRNHPQFNDLRRLVQSNPAMLQQVLTQIGQQQPELLREINEHQALFLQMMNEPVGSGGESSTSNATPSSSSSTATPALPPGMAGADPEQMAQMMQNMDPGQLQMMAQMMGLTPEQVQAVGRMLGQLPREQLQEYMAQAMGGASGGPGGPASGQQLLRLNEEEMAAVDRLTEMGFDRADAAQAFLACDKNEALAANLLMDGGFDFGDAGNDGGNNNTNNDGNDDEDMYS
mmetsp:Transcript_25060/g.37027  ORF Transcript_25060/g.37027 Transcript_25060/m.37027 type:complete len:434 (+) Transcript_25060:144-1445(+)|eukprot:CAMPEP_0194205340 /NCGR_PEP_ID=MMETSP0156-20130528/4641_1 /TAXON_ID=33649 /ORGANISM="Thalassionema nitzschioides, Strain L26-B" /LENGTH=433 /DNA_ID=CAMNT_0038931591 /DNA_START=138 /DNA_END=1439 /DNA_ORIENTATION=-